MTSHFKTIHIICLSIWMIRNPTYCQTHTNLKCLNITVTTEFWSYPVPGILASKINESLVSYKSPGHLPPATQRGSYTSATKKNIPTEKWCSQLASCP